MIFHKPKKKIEIPMLHIGGENIDYVNNFNFLCIVLNHHLNWHSHTTKIANKICKIIGILNKLKHILPHSGGSWGLGALGPAILWGPLQL